MREVFDLDRRKLEQHFDSSVATVDASQKWDAGSALVLTAEILGSNWTVADVGRALDHLRNQGIALDPMHESPATMASVIKAGDFAPAATQAEGEAFLDLGGFLAHRLSLPRLQRCPPSEQLAWLLYLVGIEGCWSGPRSFAPKSVLAHSVRGPITDDSVLIQVWALTPQGAVGRPVFREAKAASRYLQGDSSSTAEVRRQVVDASERMLADASELIPEALKMAGHRSA